MATPARRGVSVAASVLVGAVLVPATASLGVTSAASVSSAAVGGYGRLYAPVRMAIVGVPFKIDGFLTSEVRRPVKLQRELPSGSFATIARTKAGLSGNFTFRGVRLPQTSMLRAVAPRFKGDLNHAKDRVVTRTVEVKALRLTGRVSAVPGIIQQGVSPLDPEDRGYVVAQFSPARGQRPVVLERRIKGDWTVVDRARQDRAGGASFAVAPGRLFRARSGPVTTRPVRSRAWQPAFQDTFSGEALDLSVWTDGLSEGADSQDPRTCARVDPSVRHVSGGALHLGVGLDPTKAGRSCSYGTPATGPRTASYYVNSQIDSRDAFHFTHGIAAARVRWQQPKGMHGCFWLLPSGGKVPGRPDLGTEVDISEYFGDGTLKGGFGSFIHHPGPDGVNIPLASDAFASARFKPRGDDWWTSYHVFSVEWTPEQYVFRVDGREFWRENRHVSQAGEYLLFSMLTSDYELAELTPDELTATAAVDWVRVWDL